MKSVKYKPSFKNIILNKCKNPQGLFKHYYVSDCMIDYEIYYCYRCELEIYPDDYTNIPCANLYPTLYCENCNEIFFKGCKHSSIDLSDKNSYSYDTFYYPKIIKYVNSNIGFLLKFKSVDEFVYLYKQTIGLQEPERFFIYSICDNC